MTDKERIESILKWVQMRPSEFSRSIGLPKPDGIYHILNGRNGISDTMAEKILKVYPAIRKAWLLAGEGDMFSDMGNVQDPKSNYQNSNTLTQKTQTDMEAFLKEHFDALRRKDEQITELIRQHGELITKIPGPGLGEVSGLKEKIG